MISINPNEQQEQDNYKLLIGSIIPRPIAFVTTLGEDGTLNAAPFNFFSVISSTPPLLTVSVHRKNGVMKDTARNAAQRKELVIHIVDEALVEDMNKTAAPLRPEQSELELTSLTAVPSEVVSVPGIKEAKIRMECVLEHLLTIDESGSIVQEASAEGRAICDVLMVRVVRFLLSEEVYRDGHIDPNALKPVARLAGNDYARLGDIFTLIRQS